MTLLLFISPEMAEIVYPHQLTDADEHKPHRKETAARNGKEKTQQKENYTGCQTHHAYDRKYLFHFNIPF